MSCTSQPCVNFALLQLSCCKAFGIGRGRGGGGVGVTCIANQSATSHLAGTQLSVLTHWVAFSVLCWRKSLVRLRLETKLNLLCTSTLHVLTTPTVVD